MYVYHRSEPQLYTVGFYDPRGTWHPESDWPDRNDAATRVAWLNGQQPPAVDALADDIEQFRTAALRALSGRPR